MDDFSNEDTYSWSFGVSTSNEGSQKSNSWYQQGSHRDDNSGRNDGYYGNGNNNRYQNDSNHGYNRRRDYHRRMNDRDRHQGSKSRNRSRHNGNRNENRHNSHGVMNSNSGSSKTVVEIPQEEEKYVKILELPNDYPRRKYYPRNEKEKEDVKHWGQIKLCASEIQFLTKYGDLGKYVVYAGAAGGHHIVSLADLFPNHIFLLYDPAEFGPNLIRESESGFLKGRVFIYREYFTKEVAQALNDNYSNDGILFISDIRTGNPRTMEQLEHEKCIETDNKWMREWCQIMKPKRALLKFRVPYPNIIPGPSTELIGTILFQQYARRSGTESRLIPHDYENYTQCTTVDHTEYEEKFFYFNECIRKTKVENEYYNDELGLDNTYDAWGLCEIYKRYLEYEMKNKTCIEDEDIDILNNVIEKKVSNIDIWNLHKRILTLMNVNVNKLKGLKNNQADYDNKGENLDHSHFHEHEMKISKQLETQTIKRVHVTDTENDNSNTSNNTPHKPTPKGIAGGFVPLPKVITKDEAARRVRGEMDDEKSLSPSRDASNDTTSESTIGNRSPTSQAYQSVSVFAKYTTNQMSNHVVCEKLETLRNKMMASLSKLSKNNSNDNGNTKDKENDEPILRLIKRYYDNNKQILSEKETEKEGSCGALLVSCKGSNQVSIILLDDSKNANLQSRHLFMDNPQTLEKILSGKIKSGNQQNITALFGSIEMDNVSGNPKDYIIFNIYDILMFGGLVVRQSLQKSYQAAMKMINNLCKNEDKLPLHIRFQNKVPKLDLTGKRESQKKEVKVENQDKAKPDVDRDDMDDDNDTGNLPPNKRRRLLEKK